MLHELNYLEHYADFIKRDGVRTTDEAYNQLVTPVTAMMDSSPNHARVHYQQTLTALARMRDAYTRFP